MDFPTHASVTRDLGAGRLPSNSRLSHQFFENNFMLRTLPPSVSITKMMKRKSLSDCSDDVEVMKKPRKKSQAFGVPKTKAVKAM